MRIKPSSDDMGTGIALIILKTVGILCGVVFGIALLAFLFFKA